MRSADLTPTGCHEATGSRRVRARTSAKSVSDVGERGRCLMLAAHNTKGTSDVLI
jgi:hypothetical protein